MVDYNVLVDISLNHCQVFSYIYLYNYNFVAVDQQFQFPIIYMSIAMRGV